MAVNFKKRKTTEYIAIHCSATQPKADIGKREIDGWHRQQGWLGIGYHFVIKRDGTIEEGRPVDAVGSHVKNFNSNSVGVCLVGGVDAALKPENNFTDAQFHSLALLLAGLKNKYPAAKIRGHRDFPNVAKACPSFEVADWLKDPKVQELLGETL